MLTELCGIYGIFALSLTLQRMQKHWILFLVFGSFKHCTI